ncbi:hypothetical protein M6B38_238705 [Iris pallida]|uniref:Uncharacterized protein n=1 Tax=Iris pallida TaxID=29817 RepID=A0AAX6DLG8_IRIPA|nr:hypothetical protein M6B38_238705 [Iris pallida]
MLSYSSLRILIRVLDRIGIWAVCVCDQCF